MAQQTIINGDFDNDPSAEKIRVSFDKVNNNFDELYVASGLGGSIQSIDQPISMAGATATDSEAKQVADAINARTNDFTIPLGSLPLVSSYLPLVSGDNLTAYVHKNVYILNTGEGTYGTTGSIVLTASNVIKVSESIVKPDTVIDMGDIGATALSTAVNNASPSNTKLGLTLVTAVQSGVIQNYIFDAVDGAYGTADLQTSSDNFIDLNTEPDLSRNVTDNATEPFTRGVDVTIAYEDLGRTNVFTQSNSVITIDTDANLFIENGSTFLISFTGTGTHNVSVLSLVAPPTFKQNDLVFVQKIGTDNWIVSKLGEVDDSIVPLENVVHINSAADFPNAVGGVRELSIGNGIGVTYLIAATNIDMGSDRFTITDSDVVIRGVHRTASQITTTNATTMFTVVDSNFFSEYVGFTCASAKWVDFSTPSLGQFNLANQNAIIYDCTTIATIDGSLTTSFITFTILNASVNGILWSGLQNQVTISNMLGIAWVGTLLDLGTATFEIVNIGTGGRFISPIGTTILSGAAASGNLNVGGRGVVDGNLFNGIGTALSGIDTEDLRWTFRDNIFADNSTKDTEVVTDGFLTAGETVTIGSIGVYVAVGGTNWVSDIMKRFTISTAGLMTYIGLETIDVTVGTTATVSKVGGGSDIICTKIALNGVVSDKTIACTENTAPTGVASQGLFELETGDTIQLFVGNTDSTSNIVVDTASVIISKR